MNNTEVVMYCSACGTKNPDTFKFCSSCGVAMAVPAAAPAPAAPAPVAPEPTPTSGPVALKAEALSNLYPETAAPRSGMSPAWKRALTVGAIILVGNFIWFGARPYLIGVDMDVAEIEANIVSTYADDGVSVTVDCPDPFVARPGETRNCLVTESTFGIQVMAKVTVENANGTFTWVAE